jgi:hypothetical protein
MFLKVAMQFVEEKAQYVGILIKKTPHMGVSERGAARTLNQWLKRTLLEKRFSHPMSCCFRPIFWTAREASTLDEVGKVLSTV